MSVHTAASTPPVQQWVTVAESAERKQLSTKTIRRYISQGLIEAERVGPRLIRVNLASLDNLGRSLQYVGGENGDRR